MKPADFKNHLQLTLPTLIVLVAAAALRMKLGAAEPANNLERTLEIMSRTGLSAHEEDEMTAGYYEGLLDGSEKTARGHGGLFRNLGSLKPAPPDWKDFSETDAVRKLPGFLRYDIKPGVDIPFKGDRLQSNRWGMRDRDYEREKPAGVRRLALIGSSISMGTGVPIERTYEALLEAKLNAEPVCKNELRYEILNFSVPGYMFTQQLDLALSAAPQYDVDVVLFVVNYLSVGPMWSSHIATLVQDGDDLKYPFLREVTEKAGVRPSDSASRIATKLAPYRLELFASAIREAKRTLEKEGIKLVFLPVPFSAQRNIVSGKIIEAMETVSAERIPVWSCLNAFGDIATEDLRLREWDNHPNIRGHQLIFEALDNELRTNPRLREIIAGCNE